MISKISCFWDKEIEMFDTIISIILFGSFIVLTLLITSSETFLLIFWNSMNCSIISFCKALVFEFFFVFWLISVIDAVINSLLKFNLSTFALCIPSTNTLSVPSGSLSNWITLATVPKE